MPTIHAFDALAGRPGRRSCPPCRRSGPCRGAANAAGPQELMEKVARPCSRSRRESRGAAGGPGRAARVSTSHLLPHFDTDYAGQLVLGKHWRQATPGQRKRFVDAFYQSLMATTARHCSSSRGSHEDPAVQGRSAATSATVRTEVKRSNGTPVPVNYSLRKTPSGWKAWDVTIEGISYVKNYRNDFGAEVAQKGLDAVIQRLEAQNATPEAGATRRTRPWRRPADEPLLDRVRAPGAWRVRGDLDFDTAPAALARGLALMAMRRTARWTFGRELGRQRGSGRAGRVAGQRARRGARCVTPACRRRSWPSRASRISRNCLIRGLTAGTGRHPPVRVTSGGARASVGGSALSGGRRRDRHRSLRAAASRRRRSPPSSSPRIPRAAPRAGRRRTPGTGAAADRRRG